MTEQELRAQLDDVRSDMRAVLEVHGTLLTTLRSQVESNRQLYARIAELEAARG